MKQPQFYLFIGVQKAGTTSIYDLFSNYEGVNLASTKESKFFLEPDLYKGGLQAYQSLFFDPARAHEPHLDIDPDFFLYEEVPQLIFDTLGPDVKFVINFRNPARRAHSAFLMERFRKNEDLNFWDAIEAEPKRLKTEKGFLFNSYIHRGLYSQQLKRFFKFFPKENFKFFVFEEDFIQNREKMMKELCAFMQIPFQSSLAKNVQKNTTYKVKSNTIDQVYRGRNMSALRKVLKFFVPKKWRKGIREKVFQMNTSTGKANLLSPEEYDSLIQNYFKEDIAELEALINRDLSVWM